MSSPVVVKNSSVCDLLEEFESIQIDRALSQESLNLAQRKRTSISRWRGQFSPEFVELFVSQYGPTGCLVVDPFSGSGTVLYECARHGLPCKVFDVNPAANYMSRLAEIINVRKEDRISLLSEASKILRQNLSLYKQPDLFDVPGEWKQNEGLAYEDALSRVLTSVGRSRALETILVNVVLRASSPNGEPPGADEIFRSLISLEREVLELPHSNAQLTAELGDARRLPIRDDSVDLVFTSPPYINVFNYHQNYRRVVELAGFDLLSVAKTEIGSNRKNRGNRFLTVIQYCLDMELFMQEVRRIIRSNGSAIVVIGRESNVLGKSFPHGKLLYAIANFNGLCLDRRLERVFTSRYGTRVFEEILVFSPDFKTTRTGSCAVDVAKSLLTDALRQCSNDNDEHKLLLSLAIEAAQQVPPSPNLLIRCQPPANSA